MLTKNRGQETILHRTTLKIQWLHQMIINISGFHKTQDLGNALHSSSVIGFNVLSGKTIGISSGSFLVLNDALVMAAFGMVTVDVDEVGDRATFMLILSRPETS